MIDREPPARGASRLRIRADGEQWNLEKWTPAKAGTKSAPGSWSAFKFYPTVRYAVQALLEHRLREDKEPVADVKVLLARLEEELGHLKMGLPP